MDTIITNASPLMGLAKIGYLHLLYGMVSTVIVPQAVVEECLEDPTKLDARVIQRALEQHQLTVMSVNQPLELYLDKGETATITLGLELHSPVLIDEARGRKAAKEKGLTVIGTGGILCQAKQAGMITAIKPLLTQLRQVGYHLSPQVMQQILRQCGE